MAREFAMHVKGLEFPAYEPRGAFGSGLAYAVSPRGALLDDFSIVETANAIHVLNAPSPAATASLAIGEYIAARAEVVFGLTGKT